MCLGNPQSGKTCGAFLNLGVPLISYNQGLNFDGRARDETQGKTAFLNLLKYALQIKSFMARFGW